MNNPYAGNTSLLPGSGSLRRSQITQQTQAGPSMGQTPANRPMVQHPPNQAPPGDMDGNYPQHTQAPLPPHYPHQHQAAQEYQSYGMPQMGYQNNSTFSNTTYPNRNPYQPHTTSSSPSYDRYGYQTRPAHQPQVPFMSNHSPGTDVRRRESMEDHGIPPPAAGSSRHIGMMDNPEPRMGQYMTYGQNQSYEWTPVQPTNHLPGQMVNREAESGLHSRRSTISRTTDDEGIRPISAGRDLQGGLLSAPSSPRRLSVGTGSALHTGTAAEEDDEGEEKMDHRKRKRNRTIRSCVPCHNHKRKCDRKRPCGRCTALGLTGTCVYEVDEVRDMNDPTVAETDRLRKRIAELEQVVRELRQRNPARASNAPPALLASSSQASPAVGVDFDSDKSHDNKKRRVIVDRFARFKIDEAAMAAVASAAAANGEIGPPAPEVSGGVDQNLPLVHVDDAGKGKKDYKAEPYATYLLPGEEMVYDRIGRKTFLGAAAGKSMLRRLRELTTKTPQGMSTGDSDLLTVPEDAAFTGVFPDTRKTFPFTTIWSHENFSGEIIGLLPNKEQSEVLFQSWREEICSFFLAWHLPTITSEYQKFFAMSTSERMNVPLSSLSLFLMICSLGSLIRASRAEIFGHPDRQAPDMDVKPPPRDPKDLTSSRLQSELYLSGAYQALRLCSFMSNPSIHTIQSQILINIYLLNSERAADAWSQTGSLVRQCIAMGLHVDPASLDPKMSIREAEVRRRMWWTVAGLDALLCLSFGRPSVINFYNTNLPQDREDETLSDAPGTANVILPPSNVLNNETTETTYHAAYYQLAIPSYELLDRLFHVDRKYSRSAIYGWFRPAPDAYVRQSDEDEGHTYEGAIRLAQDIITWYSLLPRGMRFEMEEDTAERLSRDLPYRRINQMLALCVKTFMIIMVLHRPYLRADPLAYPESKDLCLKAALMILSAYKVGSAAKASIFWSWWTMSFRAFHAGAVCAFLAIREPGVDEAKTCMDAVKGAIDVLADRSATWYSAHPVQADLCNGLVKLHKLASAATQQQQKAPQNRKGKHDRNRLSTHWTPNAQGPQPQTNAQFPAFGPEHSLVAGTPLSQIRGFPSSPGPAAVAAAATGTGDIQRQPSPLLIPQPFQAPENLSMMGDGFNGPESFALPQFWASMFGIKMEDQAQSTL